MKLSSRFGPRLRLAAACLVALAAIRQTNTASAVLPQPPAPPAPLTAPQAAKDNPVKPGEARTIDWETLLPEEERDGATLVPPPPVHDYLGEAGMAAQQSGSFSVNAALNLATVKVPGFVVPLDVAADGMVRELFLVPYVGACIHVPPPPPNQIVYVKLADPIKLPSLYEAVWVTGTLKTAVVRSRLGSAAYTLEGKKVEPYTYSSP